MDSIISDVKASLPVKKKLCIVCETKEAKFCIKGINKTCYCKECALEQFGDLDLLEKL
jgi:hypothetical protein